MKTTGNTILITGGATGIGLAIAKRFADLGNSVIICGRRTDKLAEVSNASPKIQTIKCDITNASDRAELSELINTSFPKLNMLVNNAGIQRPLDLKKGTEDPTSNREIETNLISQIQLCALFIPILSKQKQSAIVNVTSGLGIVPMANYPVYSATKAALRSFTMSLRHQLKGTPIKVFDLIPPLVHDTYLHGEPLKAEQWTVSSADVAESLVKGMEADIFEIPVGSTSRWLAASKEDRDKAFQEINR
jgi:uncharacterized oxidoreductase